MKPDLCCTAALFALAGCSDPDPFAREPDPSEAVRAITARDALTLRSADGTSYAIPHDLDPAIIQAYARGADSAWRVFAGAGASDGRLRIDGASGEPTWLRLGVFFAVRARERSRERELRATAAALASEESLRLKDMFVGILGHDLMNPLNAIGLTTEQLARRVAGDERSATLVGRIRSSSTRMTRMIEQILDLTRARLGEGIRVNPRTIRLGPLVGDVIDEVVRAQPDGLVELETRGGCEGEWDPDRLAQVVSNLVGNAIRYRGDAPVHVVLDGTAPDRAILRVHNTGAIPAALQPVVFEPFRGSNAPKRATAGLGLGLYITRAIVLAHGGTIEVTSTAAEGTTFTVTLPRVPRPATAEDGAGAATHRVIGAGPTHEVHDPAPRGLTTSHA